MGEVAAECRHGLTADWCSICKGEGKSRAEAVNGRHWSQAVRSDDYHELSVPWTHADFESACTSCGEWIVEGEKIGLREEGWVCNECAHQYDTEAAARRRHPAGGSDWT